MAVMYGQGIVPKTHNPLYNYQNLDQVATGFEQVKRAWSATVDNLPTHEDFLKSQKMWAGEAAEAA